MVQGFEQPVRVTPKGVLIMHSNLSATPDHALLVQIARAHLKWFREHGESADRIDQIEQVLTAYEALAQAASPAPSVPQRVTTGRPRTEAVDYRSEFEAALEERDAAGYLGTSPAETIRRLAEERDMIRRSLFSDDLSLTTVGGKTEITLCDGKYTFVLAENTDCLIEIKRYGEAWSANIAGPGQIAFGRAIGSLAGVLADAFQRDGAFAR